MKDVSVRIERREKAPCATGAISLVRSEPVNPKPEAASLLTKMGRLRKELGTWIAKGALFAPREVRQERLAICQACSFYRASGNFGLGECTAPRCGCTRLKLALATSRCPLSPPKWLAFVPGK